MLCRYTVPSIESVNKRPAMFSQPVEWGFSNVQSCGTLSGELAVTLISYIFCCSFHLKATMGKTIN